LCVAVVAIVTACAGPTVPHWADAGVHAVDGFWILAERPCEFASTDPCVEQVRIAREALGIDRGTVAGASTASLPSQWVRSDGRAAQVLFNTTGSAPILVVLDLAGGSRRIAVYGCGGIPQPDGSMLCGAGPPQGNIENYRVGRSPIN